MLLTPGTMLGRYQIVAALGAGGMGEVYRARDTRLERDVALKVVPTNLVADDALERFRHEARAIAALNHPHICAIHDVGEEGNPGGPIHFLVMELLEGETLDERIRRGPLPLADLMEIGLAVADALHAAHGRQLIHRDIKPANIFLTPHGPKLLDFGLAKSTGSVTDPGRDSTILASAPLTSRGTTVGTVAYMSPEQLRGEELDARTDLFSLGLVLYEMATGRRAFEGTTSAVIAAGILHKTPTPARQLRPDLPPHVAEVIDKALEKDREDRAQTAAEVRADLRRARREAGESHARYETSTAGRSAVQPQASPGGQTDGLPAPGPRDGSLKHVNPSHGSPSSDSEMIAVLARRHRGKLALAFVAVAAVVAAVVYLTGDRNPVRRSSFDRLQVSRLTSSGNALRPSISPDGRYVAYIQRVGNEYSLWIRQTETNSNVQIVAPVPGEILHAVTVTPDGNFVDFVRERHARDMTLWRVPFLGGAPRLLASDVWSAVGWAPDGTRMAFVRPSVQTGIAALIVADANGQAERVVTQRKQPFAFASLALGARPDVRPAWSPDGRTVALPGRRDGAPIQNQIVFVDVASGTERVLDAPAGDNMPVRNVAWLDDETLVVCRGILSRLQLWEVSYPDGAMSRLTNDVNGYEGISLSADGRTLVSVIATDDGSVVVARADGSDAETVVPFGAPLSGHVDWAGDALFYGRLSDGVPAVVRHVPGGAPEEIASDASSFGVTPDGSTLVYSKSGGGGVFRSRIDGRQPARVATGGNARLTPDGQWILFMSAIGGQQQAHVVPIEGGDSRPLSQAFVGAPGAAVSHDGRRAAFWTQDAEDNRVLRLCQFASCDSTATRLPVPASAGPVGFTPDGNAVAILDPARTNIWVYPIAGGPGRQITRFTDPGEISDFAWRSDGGRLAIARRRTTTDIVLFKGFNDSE